MATNNIKDKSMIDDRIAITVEGLDLPDDDEIRDELLDDISNLIRQKAQKDGESEPDKITITDSYQYSTLLPVCPRCGEEPHFSDPTIHPDEPHVANSKLDCRHCGYTAGADYKLVDIEKKNISPREVLNATSVLSRMEK